jgi:hypothetical protein
MAGIGGALMCEMWERSSSDDGLTPASRALIVRVTSAGSLLAVAAVAVQTAVHGLNAMLTDGGYWSVNSENNPIAWAHAAAIVSSAFVCALHALLVEQRRITFTVAAVLLAFLSVDEAIQVHERIIGRVLDWTERSATWDSVLWPIVYLPICAVLAWALWRVSDEAPRPAARLLVGGLGLLVVAVLAEMVSAPWSDEDGGAVHTVEGAFEEAAELAGWIAVATGLTAVLLRNLALAVGAVPGEVTETSPSAD